MGALAETMRIVVENPEAYSRLWTAVSTQRSQFVNRADLWVRNSSRTCAASPVISRSGRKSIRGGLRRNLWSVCGRPETSRRQAWGTRQTDETSRNFRLERPVAIAPLHLEIGRTATGLAVPEGQNGFTAPGMNWRSVAFQDGPCPRAPAAQRTVRKARPAIDPAVPVMRARIPASGYAVRPPEGGSRGRLDCRLTCILRPFSEASSS